MKNKINKINEMKGLSSMRNNDRILAGNVRISNDTHKTLLNNNDLIIGGSGSGKTRGYIMPNLDNESEQSIVVADTKGNLYGKFKAQLEKRGYTVYNIDFKDLYKSPSGYNPFDYIRINPETNQYSEQDVQKMASFLCPNGMSREDFWDNIAQYYVSCAIAFIMESSDKENRNMKSLMDVIEILSSNDFEASIEKLSEENPHSYAYRCYKQIKDTSTSEKTHASALSVLGVHLFPFSTREALDMYCNKNTIHLEELGKKKTAIFLTISDSDSSMYRAVNMFYKHAFDALIGLADSHIDGRLKVPVHFYLDDFATNTNIPDFDNIISVIRSREISVSIIVQSISQLRSRYGEMANTIITNCDHVLYLGSVDKETADFMSYRMNIMPSSISTLPRNKVYILETGKKYTSTEKCFFDENSCNKSINEIKITLEVAE